MQGSDELFEMVIHTVGGGCFSDPPCLILGIKSVDKLHRAEEFQGVALCKSHGPGDIDNRNQHLDTLQVYP